MQQRDDIEELFGALESAIYSTVSGFVDRQTGQRGATGMAARLGMVPGVLANKANPAQDHQLTLRESIAVQLTGGQFSILHAYAMALNHTAYALPPADQQDDVALLTTYCDLHGRVGELAESIRDSLKDQRIDRDEVMQVRQAFDAMVRAGLGMVARIEALSR